MPRKAAPIPASYSVRSDGSSCCSTWCRSLRRRASVCAAPLTAEERARKLLQLPLGSSLAVAEIRQAFRRAAKSMHPDAGGSEEAFRDLIAAQDVLMHPGAHKHG